MPKLRVAILGSCVTRDLFTHIPEALNRIDLGPYVSRASLISMAAGAPRQVIAKLGTLVGKRFDDRRFVLDARKDYFRILAKFQPDILVLDLIDERHSTYLFDDGALTLTKVSKEFLADHGLQQLTRTINPFGPDWPSLQQRAVESLVQRLQSDLSGARFLVHAAPYASQYLKAGEICDFADQTLIQRWNGFLEAAYARLAEGLQASLIRSDSDSILAGGQHLWDLAPFHYDIGYYRSAWSALAPFLDQAEENRLLK